MKSAIIGKALIVAWSFTLSNLGPTSQLIDLGTAPTDNNYVPVTAVFRNMNGKGFNNRDKLIVTLGTDPKQPNNVTDIENMFIGIGNSYGGYLAYDLGGKSIVPADHDLYVKYSLPKIYPTTDKPVEVDILAYPTS